MNGNGKERLRGYKAKITVLGMSTIMALFMWTATAAGSVSESIHSETREVLGKSVQVVTVDFTNPNLRFDVVKGNDQRTGWEDFQSMLDRTQPAAAINGNYFNAYAHSESDMIPWGYIIKDGEIINSGAAINRGSFAVSFDREMIIHRGEAFSKENIETMVEAGPLLMKNGSVVYNPHSGGFTEDKINRDPAQRSAIGIRPNGQAILVTGSRLRMVELAEIMEALGSYAATNLDGGASSALYANGNMITQPGRKLNTVLVVYDDSTLSNSLPVENIQVFINKEPLVMEVPPTVINGRTMVPLRAIFEGFGVEPEWNAETRTVVASAEETEVILPLGQQEATVNGETIELDAPGTILEGRTMVPARFIAESLGAEVEWNAETRTVIIETKE